MTQKTIPNERAIIDEILRRKASDTKEKRIPAAKMEIFKAKLDAEIKRTGNLRPEFMDELLKQLRNGEL